MGQMGKDAGCRRMGPSGMEGPSRRAVRARDCRSVDDLARDELMITRRRPPQPVRRDGHARRAGGPARRWVEMLRREGWARVARKAHLRAWGLTDSSHDRADSSRGATHSARDSDPAPQGSTNTSEGWTNTSEGSTNTAEGSGNPACDRHLAAEDSIHSAEDGTNTAEDWARSAEGSTNTAED